MEFRVEKRASFEKGRECKVLFDEWIIEGGLSWVEGKISIVILKWVEIGV